MARILILEAKKTGEKFRLITGALRSDMSEPAEVRAVKIQQRTSNTLSKIDDHLKEHADDEIVVKKTGFAD